MCDSMGRTELSNITEIKQTMSRITRTEHHYGIQFNSFSSTGNLFQMCDFKTQWKEIWGQGTDKS